MADLAVGFAQQLRMRGLVVPPDTVIAYAKALDAVGLDDRDEVYWAGRATLVRRPEDVAAYDAAFTDYWAGQASMMHRSHTAVTQRTLAVDEGGEGEGDDAGDADEVLRWSAVEVLRAVRRRAGRSRSLDRRAPPERAAPTRPPPPAGQPRRARPPPHGRARVARRRRARAPPARRAWRAPPPHRPPDRRVGLDGGVRAGPAALRPRRRAGARRRRGVLARHPAHALDRGARHPRRRRRADRRHRGGARLRGRHPAW